MSIERLSGGLSPADGADPRTFPEIFNGFADEFEGKNIPAFGTAAPSDGDALVYNDADGVYEPGEGGAGSLEDLTDTEITTPVAGEKLVYDGTEWVNLEAYAFVETVTFTSNGTFSKGDYPWLRAIRVKCLGGGSAGGGAALTGSSSVSAGGGGASGGFAESFITDIAGLASSVTVTVGSGGLGVDDADGNDGNDSSFGALVIAFGGFGGLGGAAKTETRLYRGGIGGTSGVGDLGVRGNGGGFGVADISGTGQGGLGGASFFGGAGRGIGNTDGDGFDGSLGGGGGGANNRNNVAIAAKGGDGGDGIVIVELFA